jgi:hypothetical protein
MFRMPPPNRQGGPVPVLSSANGLEASGLHSSASSKPTPTRWLVSDSTGHAEKFDPGDPVVTVSLVFNLQVLYLVAAVITTLLIYILIMKRRDRQNREATARINNIVGDYFKSHNVEVLVTSYAVLGGRRFVVLLESKPNEKLRSSHVIEMGLIDHVRKTTGQFVERVFWRFPVPVIGKEEVAEDLYLAQGFHQIRSGEGYSVTETPWEQFDKAMVELKEGVGAAAGQYRKTP